MHNKSEDRGMMKWAPFYSVLSEKEINENIDKSNIDEMPELSEEQLDELENIIICAYNNKSNVKMIYFEGTKKITSSGIINKLDPIHKSIYLNKKMILFSNIYKVTIE